jgi:hypothetical protein
MEYFRSPPRRDSLLILAIVGVFIAGMTAGGLLFMRGNQQPVQTASSDGRMALAFFLTGAPNAGQ